MSTIDRQRGQVLVIFAGGLAAMILLAALAFDAGAMLLERRDQQDAADAAAIAGARYLPDNSGTAAAAATSIAAANGFTQGGPVHVTVNIPPRSGQFAGRSGFIEVLISSTRPSIFAGIMGVVGWPVGARAVAANESGAAGDFAILALEPKDCDAMLVSGSGAIVANGNIQVNSVCDKSPGALHRAAGGTIQVVVGTGTCNAVGMINDGGGKGAFDCVPVPHAPTVPDPLAALAPPAMPSPANAPVQLSGTATSIPDGCPGSSKPASTDAPAVCQFSASYAHTGWRLYPGLYPGGLKLLAGEYYLEPGIYYIGGGGLQAGGSGTIVRSVVSGTKTLGGGIMIYNSALPKAPVGPIQLGGSTSDVKLWQLNDGSRWDGLVVFWDRNEVLGGTGDIDIEGSTSELDVLGTIYAPTADVTVNGSTGQIMTDQIISLTYKVNGSTGTITASNDADRIFKVTIAGLVE